MNAYVPADTTLEAAAVQRDAYARMDGFDRMRVTATMRKRVVAMLWLRYPTPEEVTAHLFRRRVPPDEWAAISARMGWSSDAAQGGRNGRQES